MTEDKGKKGLFVLHEGIGSTIFNSQVLEHVKGMQEKNISLDILCYDTLDKTWDASKKNQHVINTTYPTIRVILKKGINIYYPFALLYNAYLLINFLSKNLNNYSFIHARADYSTFLCILTKPFHKLPVYWDCRGDSVGELEDSLARKGFWIKLLGRIWLTPRECLIVNFNAKNAFGAIFVSSELKKLYELKLRTKRISVIPCLVSEEKFFFDKDLRLTMRTKLGVSDLQKVYLYSGSMIAYQSIAEQKAMYDRILKDEHNIVFILTSEPDIAKEYFKDLPQHNLKISSASFSEVNLYYNIADFAFLLRDNKRLNWVASPTKFGEYCLTGLPVIMNDTVAQAVDVSKEIENYISYQNPGSAKFDDLQRETIAQRSKQFYSRNILIERYVQLYNSL